MVLLNNLEEKMHSLLRTMVRRIQNYFVLQFVIEVLYATIISFSHLNFKFDQSLQILELNVLYYDLELSI